MRIGTRVKIQKWETGEVPSLECKGLFLKSAEVCHWEQPARLFEPRTRRVYVGGSQGVSIRLMRGVRYHISGFRGTPIDTEYLADAGPGVLHLASARLCFAGTQQSVAIDYRKIINVAAFEDGFQVHRTGAKKPTVIQVPQPDLTLQLLALASCPETR
jgi:hypothetical protein